MCAAVATAGEDGLEAVSVRGMRRADPRALLSPRRRQAVARQLSQVLAVSPVARLTTHLLREGRADLLQGGLLQVGIHNIINTPLPGENYYLLQQSDFVQ